MASSAPFPASIPHHLISSNMLSRISGRAYTKPSAVANVLKRGLAMPSRAHRATEAQVSFFWFGLRVYGGEVLVEALRGGVH